VIHFLKSQHFKIYFIIKVVVFAQKMRSFGTTPTKRKEREQEERKREEPSSRFFLRTRRRFRKGRRRRSDDDFAKKHYPKSRLCFDLSENNNTKNKNNNSASSPPPPPFPSPQMPLSSPVDGSGNDGGDFVPVLIPSLSLSSSSSSANGDGDGVGTTPTRTTAASSSSSSLSNCDVFAGGFATSRGREREETKITFSAQTHPRVQSVSQREVERSHGDVSRERRRPDAFFPGANDRPRGARDGQIFTVITGEDGIRVFSTVREGFRARDCVRVCEVLDG